VLNFEVPISSVEEKATMSDDTRKKRRTDALQAITSLFGPTNRTCSAGRRWQGLVKSPQSGSAGSRPGAMPIRTRAVSRADRAERPNLCVADQARKDVALVGAKKAFNGGHRIFNIAPGYPLVGRCIGLGALHWP
jgi:hypothetical protein